MTTPAVLTNHFGNSLLRPLTTPELAELSTINLFCIVFSNRSGSTLLADSLYRRGLPIPPQVEILDPELILQVAISEKKDSFTDYFIDTVLGWRDRGMCGFKAGVDQLRWLEKLGLLWPFKSRCLIQIGRSDKVAQAVSLYLARGTGQWHHAMQATRHRDDITYSAEGIRDAFDTIEKMDADIHRYASDRCLPTHSLYYESLVADPEQALGDCCRFLGWDPQSLSARDDGVPPLKSQHSSLNTAFAERYCREESARKRD